MAKLPTRDDLSAAPSARSGRPIATYDVSAIAKGQIALGKAIQGAGEAGIDIVKHQERLDEYDAEVKLQDFRWNEEIALDDAKQTVQPGQAGAFADEWRKGYAGRADEFLKAVPDAARPRLLPKLKAAERGLFRDAATFARTEQKRASLAGIDDFTNDKLPRVTSPEAFERFRTDYEARVDGNPWLSPIAKDEAKRKGLRHAEKFYLEARNERDPSGVLTDLGFGPELDADENPETRAKPFGAEAAPAERGSTFQIPDAERARLPAGMRNNNPGNIKYTSRKAFAGVTGPSENTDQGDPQAVFSTPQEGMNAAADLALRKYKGGKTTPMELIAGRMGWTPGNERAAANVARTMGIDPDDDLELDKPENMANFLKALTLQEHGQASRLYPDELYQRASGGKAGPVRVASADGYSGPYRHLTPDDRLDLARAARARIKAGIESQREVLKQSLDDDIESIRRTGQSANPDIEAASRVLEPNQVNRYRLNRQEAEMEYGAMRDLPTLPEAALQQRLADIEPKPGEQHFEMKAKVFDRVKTALDGENGIRTLRETDPARAVDAVPEVKAATEALRAAPDDPAALQALTRARLDAQTKVGIPSAVQSPISKAEARVLAAPLKNLEGAALKQAIAGWKESLDERYGPYARSVALSAIDMAITKDRELADIAEEQINKLLTGQRPSAALVRRGEFISDVNAATQAFGGDFVGDPRLQYGLRERGGPVGSAPQEMPAYGPRQPPQGAIDLLIGNPALAPAFNSKYGPGAAERILAESAE